MPAINLKYIPDRLYEQVELSAKLRGRSINEEIVACLENEFLASRLSADERISRVRELRARSNGDKISARDVAAAIRSGRPSTT